MTTYSGGCHCGKIRFEVDATELPAMHRATFSLSEAFDIGVDTGTQVSEALAGDRAEFQGELDKVIFTIDK